MGTYPDNEKLVLGYIRVSTKEQQQDGASLGDQVEKISAYCFVEDLKPDVIMWDPGFSGKSIDGRPGMKEILRLVREGRVGHVIIYKLDRLGRNTIELLQMIDMFAKHGVTFHSIHDKFDTSSAIGKFCLTIMCAMAQLVRDMIAERTQEVMDTMKKNGRKISSQAPFGFYYNEDGMAVVNEHERDCLETLMGLRADHPDWSLRKLAAELEARGYLTRTDRRFSAGGIKSLLESDSFALLASVEQEAA